MLSPKLKLAQRRRLLARANPDLIVMQGARHPLNRPALYPDWPIVYDMDDADFHLAHLSDPVQAAMPQVAAVLAGSRYIANWCREAGAGAAHVVWTGTPVSAGQRRPQGARGPVVAWAQTRPMTYIREAEWVRRVIGTVGARHPGGVTLRLFDRRPGDDPGFAAGFEAPGVTVEWVKAAPYASYLARMDDVALGLAPLSPETDFSRGKSFGKILAYLDRHVPVIASDMGEHPAFFTRTTGVLSNDPGVWHREALRLLGDAGARQAMAEAAFADFQRHLTLPAAAARVDQVLRDVLEGVSPARQSA